MMEQTGGAQGLSKLHLEKILDNGLRPHTKICPLSNTSAKYGGDAKSQQPQLTAMSCFSIFDNRLVPNFQLNLLLL